ncbi:MAG: response regulator [Opitutae bacterium]|nr:response regulator [Opitutae bacterium]
MSLKDILDAKGYNVRSVSNGFDALKECDANFFDLVIIDIRMPGINGVESIRQIKEILDYAPKFFVVTAYAVDELREEALRLGVEEFLSKPIDVQFLIKRIESMFSRKRTSS